MGEWPPGVRRRDRCRRKGKVIAVEERTGSVPTDLLGVVEEYRDAYQARDVERMMKLFADDAELVWAAGAFRGKDAVRQVLEWDVRLSPTAVVRDAGMGAIGAERTVVPAALGSSSASSVSVSSRSA